MTKTFQRVAGYSALVAGAASVVFTFAFAVVVRQGERWAQWASWGALLAGGLAAIAVGIALYRRLAPHEPEFSLMALVLATAGALGAVVHAAYELSLLANPVAVAADLPNAVDPRGVMTFGVTGVAIGLLAWLILRTAALPRRAGQLGIAAAVLLGVVYVGRLTVLDPETDVIRVAALASGLAAIPGFYLEVARALLGTARPAPTSEEVVAA